jgi:hypothetical protein
VKVAVLHDVRDQPSFRRHIIEASWLPIQIAAAKFLVVMRPSDARRHLKEKPPGAGTGIGVNEPTPGVCSCARGLLSAYQFQEGTVRESGEGDFDQPILALAAVFRGDAIGCKLRLRLLQVANGNGDVIHLQIGSQYVDC